ncbi:hypothetical protein BDN72DRAFT_901712 [Pluteus cervinus]|uniref:Uncharacterized protein n=1 Tax=Pluteus cervinus TaxID=181527 RepID=A0ACD3AFR4_9AGAR|nr:hypothetical protein BDN72DRAFT_901712 [Pluteus cervinus]
MDLPQELIEAIIDHADRDSVRNFALTAHRFVPVCRRILFYNARLYPTTMHGDDINDRVQQLLDIFKVSPQIAQFIRGVRIDVDTTPSPGFEKLLSVCMTHITSPHRVAFDGRDRSWDSFAPELADALTSMIRRPTLRACSLRRVDGFPFSVSSYSQIHDLVLDKVVFSRSETPASSLMTSKPIQLRYLEYSPTSTRPPLSIVPTPFRDSMQQLGFDFSHLQSLALTFTQHIPGIATLLTDCGASLQSLTLCGEVEIDLSPLSRIQNLALDIFIDFPLSGSDTAPLLASIATLKTLNPSSRSTLRNVTLDICLTEASIALFGDDTWDSLDMTLFRLFKDRDPLGTVSIELSSSWDGSTEDLYLEFTNKLPKCQGAGILVRSVRKI